jgi:hypothetical protein
MIQEVDNKHRYENFQIGQSFELLSRREHVRDNLANRNILIVKGKKAKTIFATNVE